MFGLIDTIKSKADALKFAIVITSENVYQDGRIIPTVHLSDAKRVYEMFEDLNLPDYQKEESYNAIFDFVRESLKNTKENNTHIE